ncbi:hypothetical protein HXY33_05290 [Candidatus Bathyarchaeota archaeon]|nr:hypothetical protein [Candidatus Bathyarchaeota archaeon]
MNYYSDYFRICNMQKPITYTATAWKNETASKLAFYDFSLYNAFFLRFSLQTSLFFIEIHSSQKHTAFPPQAKNLKTCFRLKTPKEALFWLFCLANGIGAWTSPWPHKETIENLHTKPEVPTFENASNIYLPLRAQFVVFASQRKICLTNQKRGFLVDAFVYDLSL